MKAKALTAVVANWPCGGADTPVPRQPYILKRDGQGYEAAVEYDHPSAFRRRVTNGAVSEKDS